MISIKGGTHNWAPTAQESSLKADNTRTLSPEQKEKLFGKESLGEMLNKIADPNWVSPEKRRHVGSNKLGKDAFMKLLLAQLKNQDPTNPMKSHEMAAQLAQFSQLEKLENINSGINKLTQESDKSNFASLSLIGKAVTGDSTDIIHSEKSEAHDIHFQLAKSGLTGEIRIRDKQGNVVRKQDLISLKKGDNVFNWNGKNDSGQELSPGEYFATIEVKDLSGEKIPVETKFQGIVTGVNLTAQGPMLLVGNKKVRLKDVKQFVDAAHFSPEKSHEVKGVKTQKEKAKQNVAPAPNSDLLKNVAMSQNMMNKIKKVTGQ